MVIKDQPVVEEMVVEAESAPQAETAPPPAEPAKPAEPEKPAEAAPAEQKPEQPADEETIVPQVVEKKVRLSFIISNYVECTLLLCTAFSKF